MYLPATLRLPPLPAVFGPLTAGYCQGDALLLPLLCGVR